MLTPSLQAELPPKFIAQAKEIYEKTRETFHKQSTNAALACEFARVSFDWADVVSKNSEREKITTEALAACRQVLASAPRNVAAHYFLALNLGQHARTKTLGAFKVLNEMEAELLTADRLDPAFDFGGPARSLGILYRDAPSWPLSLGDKTKSREQLTRAVQLAPDHPDNKLTLLESYEKWGDETRVRQELPQLEKLMTKARPRLTGPSWEASWADWDDRLATLKKKVGI